MAKHSLRRAAAGVVAALGLACGLAPGTAARAEPDPVATPADPVQAAALELVLDASGSMAARDSSGVTRLEAAKNALRQVIGGLNDNARVGLRVYGGRTGTCTDTTLAVKVGRLDRAALTTALDRFSPKGETPIALALQQAARDLPGTGPRTIVLVSDGISTCAPDPCPVARQLAASGADLRINTVGFAVDAASRAQLTCVAQQTRGHYYEAKDASQLAAQLSRVSVRAFRAYTPTGAPITGTTSSTGAPALTSGEWVDTIKPGQARYYTVTFPARTTPYVTATLVRPMGRFGEDVVDGVSVGLETVDGADCGETSDSEYQNTQVTPATVTVALPTMGAAKWPAPFGYYTEKGCGRPGKYALRVERNDDRAGGPDAFPLELSVLVEPPAETTGLPAPATTPRANDTSADPPPAPDFTTLPGRAPGGGGYTDAGTLRTGVVSDTIRAGETLFWRVRLTWGQRLSYAVRFDRTGRDGSAYAATWVDNPVRQRVEPLGSETGYYDGDSSGDLTVLRNHTVPVGYRNRDNAKNDAVRSTQVAGWYYLAVRLTDDEELAGVDVPLQVAVAVDGEPAGVPRYYQVAGAVSAGQLAAVEYRAAEPERTGLPLRTIALVGAGLAALMLAAGLVFVPIVLARQRR